MPIPNRFWTPKLPKYKDDSDPKEFIRAYTLTIEANGGGQATMAKCFPPALEGVTLRWFWELEPGSTYAWAQLRDTFSNNFQGTFVKPVTSRSLYAIKQQLDEIIRQYFQRFTKTKA